MMVIISLAVLVGVSVTYFVLGQLIETGRLERDRLDRIFIEDTRPEEEELSAVLRQYQRQMNVLTDVLDERSYSEPFFTLLETTTHPDVFFSTLQGNSKTGVFRLSGEAASFIVLEQQRLAWRELNVAAARLEGIQFSPGGKSGFSVGFEVDPEILKPR